MEANKGFETRQFVVFKMDKEEYGVDIQKVTTIERMVSIARVPKTPEFINGVINLRGEIIPIINLRKRFDLPQIEESEDTRIIIMKIGEISAGIIVDAVAEVTQLTEESIETVSSFSTERAIEYIMGVGKIDNRIITLLDLEKLVRI